jgi:Fe-S-cluster containining protein
MKKRVIISSECQRCGLCCVRCGSKMYMTNLHKGLSGIFPKGDNLSKPCEMLRWVYNPKTESGQAVCAIYKKRPIACRDYPFGKECHLQRLIKKAIIK